MNENQNQEKNEEQVRPSQETGNNEQTAPQSVIYQRDYSSQTEADHKRDRRERRRGAMTFAVVMTVCFAVTLLLLVASLISDDLLWPQDKTNTLDHAVGDGGNVTPSDPENTQTLSMQQIYAQGKNVVVAVSAQTSLGTGVGTGIILTSDGYIATNCHVVDGAQTVKVGLYDGRAFDAEIVGVSEIDDLAVLKIEAQDLPTATFGDSSKVVEGDRVAVIGHPAGLEFGWTGTYGYISAINRDVKIRAVDGTLTKKMTLLQTDANVNTGNSGGPMFNEYGEVIGIITLKLAGDYEGMGFAIPSNGAVPLLEALMLTGTTDGVQSEVSSARPMLGITGVSVEKDMYYVLGEDRIYGLSEETAAETEGSFRARATGILITSVSQAADAHGKIMEGDIVTALNGEAMKTVTQMREVLYDCSIGDTVELTYVRDGVEGKVEVLLVAAE